VSATGGGRVTVSPSANSYAAGQSVTITAVPNPGASFLNWSGDVSGSQNPLTVVLNQSHQAIANFSQNQSLAISLFDGGSSDAGIQLDVAGQLGMHFRLESSANAYLWTPLLDATNSVGTMHYFDSGITNQPAKFYRALILP
jgi:hypothetical protein